MRKSQTFNVPNLFSLGNLMCGCVAILKISEGELMWTAYLVGIACVFDFLDGFAARTLKVHSLMGKELDSLADCVTFGIVPALVMVKLLTIAFSDGYFGWGGHAYGDVRFHSYISYLGFVVALFSALRLAKFNVDKRQLESFIGLPTLANAIFICSLPLVLRIDSQRMISLVAHTQLFDPFQVKASNELPAQWIEDLLLNRWFLLAVTFVFSFLLLSPIPMFSFKIKSLKWEGNGIRYIFLGLSLVLVIGLQLTAIPLIILLYILLSLLSSLFKKKTAAETSEQKSE